MIESGAKSGELLLAVMASIGISFKYFDAIVLDVVKIQFALWIDRGELLFLDVRHGFLTCRNFLREVHPIRRATAVDIASERNSSLRAEAFERFLNARVT